jgi:integrase
MWTIPATRGNEPGMKKKREHRVPLSMRCVEILQEAKELSEGDYIFPGGKTGRPLSDMAMNMAKRRMDWKGSDCDVHGFRSSFRDWAAEKTKFPREVIEAALAHKVESKTEASYFRSDLFEKRRELMKAWAAYAISTPATKIVSIRSR